MATKFVVQIELEYVEEQSVESVEQDILTALGDYDQLSSFNVTVWPRED